MHSVLISPSILAADFRCLSEELKRVQTADMIHIDVMDGVFVPNISFGSKVAQTVSQCSALPLDVHLMVADPERHLMDFAAVKPRWITVHYEAACHLQRVLRQIRDLGIGVGVALNPHTPLQGLKYVLPDIDMVLIMTVNPGYGGQTFIPAMLEKIRDMRTMAGKQPLHIQVDGGVTPANCRQVIEAGADILVAGSAIFGSPDPAQTIESLRQPAE